MKTKLSEIDRTFNVSLGSNSNFKVSLEKTNQAIPMKLNGSQSTLATPIDKSDNSIDAKSDINNTPDEDVWYDEIIYYDGGGVDGYGD